MDGMDYFGREFLTAQYVAAADRRAVRTAVIMTLAVIVITVGSVLALDAMGLLLPGAEALGTLAVGA